jgi:heme/copper-type cytochrome/quinol oxidase subunit 2
MDTMALIITGAITIISIASVGLFLWALVDVLRSKLDATMKILWVLVIIFIPLIGSILYLVIGRREKKSNARSTP